MNNTSFRDPSGFLFQENDILYRQINFCYQDNYDFLIQSGLYQTLADKKYLIPHQEVILGESFENAYKIIEPEKIDFISYPYEWCFSQLKDAALLTLKIQKLALKRGMSLKDASCYNVQFKHGRPIFIDTLSFEKYKENTPWVAYKQFCQHFLAPLALMSFVDIRLNQLLVTNIDGIHLELAAKQLPLNAKLNFGLLAHIFMHADSQKKHEESGNKSQIQQAKMSLFNQEALIESLIDCVNSLKLPNIKTEWGDYYNNTNYSDDAFFAKKDIVSGFIEEASPKMAYDLGANNGEFSRLASGMGISTIAFDIDPIAVEKNYLSIKNNIEENILPLVQDLTNPSPAIGFANDERASFAQRANADLVMALALIHHLAISNNLPFSNLAKFFSSLSKYLIIEFVPKSDSKVQTLLATREDIFPGYSKENFEFEFQQCFNIIKILEVSDSQRTIYLMERK